MIAIDKLKGEELKIFIESRKSVFKNTTFDKKWYVYNKNSKHFKNFKETLEEFYNKDFESLLNDEKINFIKPLGDIEEYFLLDSKKLKEIQEYHSKFYFGENSDRWMYNSITPVFIISRLDFMGDGFKFVTRAMSEW